MSAITTHVLDVVLGRPAVGITVRLEKFEAGMWVEIGSSTTDNDGRCRDLVENAGAGTYQLTFATGDYLRTLGRTTIYPEISITFTFDNEAHYHLPLLLSDNSYTTYRGS